MSGAAYFQLMKGYLTLYKNGKGKSEGEEMGMAHKKSWSQDPDDRKVTR